MGDGSIKLCGFEIFVSQTEAQQRTIASGAEHFFQVLNYLAGHRPKPSHNRWEMQFTLYCGAINLAALNLFVLYNYLIILSFLWLARLDAELFQFAV